MFVDRVIDELNRDDFSRSFKSAYFSAGSAFSKNISKPTGDLAWSVYYGAFFIRLDRTGIKIKLSWRQKYRLTKAFEAAMKRLKQDRREYVKELAK